MNEPVCQERVDRVPRHSFAQNMEDILLDRVFHAQRGTYMDIGANHPLIESNTQFFYLRGWRGVNLEPIPRNHELFVQHRPGDENLAVAASDFDGEMPFFEIANDGGLTGHSTLSTDVAEHHRIPGFHVVEYQVAVRTVGSLIEQYGIAPPDFLSIDVEGHEDRVIRGIPFERWRPKVLVVESLVPLEHLASHASWEPTLLENGYLFATSNGINRFYLRADLKEKLPLFQTPVNVLDQFKTYNTYLLELHIQELERRQAADTAQFAELRAGWEFGVDQSRQAKAAWERACEAFDQDRARWAESVAAFEEERARWAESTATLERARADADLERERLLAEWEGERARFHQLLVEAQRELRPYRLIDRFRVVNASYGWARQFKRKRAS